MASKEAAETFLGGYLDVFLGHQDDSLFSNSLQSNTVGPACVCVGVISVLHNVSELLTTQL